MIGFFAFAPEGYEPPPVLGLGVLFRFAVVTFGPMGVLVLDAMRNERLNEGQRTQWVLILVLLAVFTMPVSFWQYRWPRVRESPAQGAA